MSREALVHIGMHKTGTSSIQHTFAGYSDPSWRYLDLGDDPNHSRMTALAFRNKPPARFHEGEALQAAHLGARRTIETALASDRRSVVISAEELWTLPTEDEVARVVDFLAAHVDSIRVLAYVRDPVSFAPSLFQQVLHRQLPPEDLRSYVPPYRKRLKKWRHVVGARNFELVAFDRAGFHGGDLLVDFATRVGLSAEHARTRAKRTNESWSAEAVATIFALRRRLADVPDGATKERLFRGLLFELKGFGEGRFAFSLKALAPGLRKQMGQIAWLEKVLGAPLPEPALDGRVCFDSLDDIAAYAETLGAALAEHPGVVRLGLSADVGRDPVGALERVARRML